MDFTTEKYRVSVGFCHKQAFFGKTACQNLWIFGQNLKILKKLYMPIMCNRSMIWASRSIEIKFHSAFAINLRFTLKTKVNTFIF
jgi:hypothetical protein